MANRYKLYNINNELLCTITDQSLKVLDTEFPVEVEIIERSYKPGADFPGIQRDESKELVFTYDINYQSEQDFRNYYNLLSRNFRATRTIRDDINSMTTDVLLNNQSVTYDEGGFNLGAKVTVTFVQLTPYWEDAAFTTLTASGIGTTQIVGINNGYIDTPPIITLTALEQITKFSIRILETGDGILIRDLQFGINGLNTYIIDNKEGTSELNQLDRRDKIKSGTGFFDMQVGSNTFDIQSNGNMLIEINFKKRYYI